MGHLTEFQSPAPSDQVPASIFGLKPKRWTPHNAQRTDKH